MHSSRQNVLKLICYKTYLSFQSAYLSKWTVGRMCSFLESEFNIRQISEPKESAQFIVSYVLGCETVIIYNALL